MFNATVGINGLQDTHLEGGGAVRGGAGEHVSHQLALAGEEHHRAELRVHQTGTRKQHLLTQVADILQIYVLQ